MKISTFHKSVWKINDKEILIAQPLPSENPKLSMKRYEIDKEYVGVVYSATDKIFELYVGRRVNAEETIKHIVGLGIKLDVDKIILKKCEVIKQLKIWDHHTQVINKMLERTSDF